jgi:hypothetical protein
MRRDDHSSRGVLPSVVRLFARSRNLKKEEASGPQKKIMIVFFTNISLFKKIN